MLRKPFKTPFKVPFKEVPQNVVPSKTETDSRSQESSSSKSKSPDSNYAIENGVSPETKVVQYPIPLQELRASQGSDSDLEFRTEDVPRQRMEIDSSFVRLLIQIA